MSGRRVTILGARGMLGTDVARLCRQHGYDLKLLDVPEFDITDYSQLKAAVGDGELVVNCAAYTNVDRAEDERQRVYQVNAAAVGQLGQIARARDAWVLHISTDFVFDGKQDRPYRETDQPNPINHYGRTKLAGEWLLAESGARWCVLRIQWTYGRVGENFITKIMHRADSAPVLRVVDDQIGSPTATTEVAKVICALLDRQPEGVFHFASDGYASRFEVAKFVFDRTKKNVTVVPCSSDELTARARRPLNSRFDCAKLKALLQSSFEPWQRPLERFLEQL